MAVLLAVPAPTSKAGTAKLEIVMPLTDTAIRKTKPSKVAQKLRDGHGLYLLIKPNDSRLWRWDYRRPVTGKRNTLRFNAAIAFNPGKSA